MTHRRLPSVKLVPRNWHFDPGLLLAFALALLAALPFLTRPGLPRGTDAELHVFRAAELGYSLRANDFYPRWAPDFYYGYGYPIFNYYAPLTYYLANLFHLMPGITIVAGVKLVFILGFVSASVGAYLFVRDSLGPRAALLAAGLYLFSPYVFFVDPHMRGVLAESFSLGLFPLALWSYHRLLVDGRRRWIACGAIMQAALIMSHNLLGLVFTALLLAYLTWQLSSRFILQWRQAAPRTALARWWPEFGRVILTLSLGIGLSAIFWLPVILERDDVLLNLTGPGHFDFHNHFLTLRELLAPTPVLDLSATAPRYGLNLGLPQWPLALLALPALFWGSSRLRRMAAFFLLCSFVLLLLMLPVSAPIWETVSGMTYLQFPWRLLGPIGATVSMAAAAGWVYISQLRVLRGRGVRREWWEVGSLGLGVALTLWLALPAMFPPLWEADFGPTDPAAIIEYELTGVAVGTTSTGDYLPTTVEIKPHPEPVFLASYLSPGGVDKVNRATLGGDTVVELISHGPTHDRFRVESSKPFILRLFTFYFPGWRATIDDHEAPVELGRPEGFITVPVPSGAHTVEVRLGALATPARALAALISLLAVVALLLIGVWGPRFGLHKASPPIQPARDEGGPIIARLDNRAALVVGSVMLAFFVVKIGLVDWQHDWFRYSSPPGQVLGARYSLAEQSVRFGDHIQLLGYDLPRAEVRSGDKVPLTLYWQATTPVPENYQVFAHLTRPATHLWGQSDHLNPGDVPTVRWPLDKYVRDEHELNILAGTPPGDYQLTVGLYTLADGVRLPVFDGNGKPLGNTFTLPTPVRITQPFRPPRQDALGLTDEIGVDYSGQVTLLGATILDRVIEVPGFAHLALLWRAELDNPEDITVRVQLVDGAGSVMDEIITQPVDGQYPSSLWSAGEVVRDQYSFWLDEAFAPGTYALRVSVEGVDGWESLGQIEVLGP